MIRIMATVLKRWVDVFFCEQAAGTTNCQVWRQPRRRQAAAGKSPDQKRQFHVEAIFIENQTNTMVVKANGEEEACVLNPVGRYLFVM